MRTKLTGLLFIFLIIAGVFIGTKLIQPVPLPLSETERLQSEMTLISHAGSGLPEGAYSNSLEALERSVTDDINYIEVDLSWTADSQIVLLHDWNRELNEWFDLPLVYRVQRRISGRDIPITEIDFLSLDMRSNLTQMALDDLIEWLRKNPKTRIITDTKEKNLAALRVIATSYPTFIEQFVPQIYNFDEYDKVLDLGFFGYCFYRLSKSCGKLGDRHFRIKQ